MKSLEPPIIQDKTSRPLRERKEFQLELMRKLEIQVRGQTQRLETPTEHKKKQTSFKNPELPYKTE